MEEMNAHHKNLIKSRETWAICQVSCLEVFGMPLGGAGFLTMEEGRCSPKQAERFKGRIFLCSVFQIRHSDTVIYARTKTPLKRSSRDFEAGQ